MRTLSKMYTYTIAYSGIDLVSYFHLLRSERTQLGMRLDTDLEA